MCLVEIEIASDIFPRLFLLLILTTLFSTNSPAVETSPATLPGSGSVMEGWDVAAGEPAQCLLLTWGPKPTCSPAGSYKETQCQTGSPGLSEPSVT